MLENPKVISRGRVAQIGEHLLRQQRVKMKSNSSYSFNFNEMARPERFELPTFWFVVGKAGNPKALQVSHLQAAPASKSCLSWYTR